MWEIRTNSVGNGDPRVTVHAGDGGFVASPLTLTHSPRPTTALTKSQRFPWWAYGTDVRPVDPPKALT